MNFEDCRLNLEKLVVEYDSDKDSLLNESTTRFRYIDEILLRCLNWKTTEITCEDREDNTISDYTLKLFRPIAILEAKKNGVYFELPVGSRDIYTPLKTIIKGNQQIADAIDQVRNYCSKRSIQIGIVCNGWQIVAFVANRLDSIPVLDGKALVVDSLSKFESNFLEVWNCLSRTGFEEEYLVKKLLGNSEQELPPKLSSTLQTYPGLIARNQFQNELELISDLVLEDIIKDKDIEKDFLIECYCKSGALSSYSLISKAILKTRYDYLFSLNDKNAIISQVNTKKGISDEFINIFSSNITRRPVLLVGDVGVGKSTFIDYLIKVDATNEFEKSITFKIDLGAKTIISYDLKKAIIEEIKYQLKTNYSINIEEDNFVRHCYYKELQEFKSNVRVARLYKVNKDEAESKEIEYLETLIDNEVEHLKKSLEYICKNQNKQIITFIDNCDQRSDKDQEQAFLISNEFASVWPMLVFISIRPETFHKAKKGEGALSGYHTKAFTIPPPKLDEVLIKRLTFAKRISSGEVPVSQIDLHANFKHLTGLINVFLFSIEQNDQLLNLLNNISNENVRKSIELVKKFFGSGHVDTKKILEIYEKEGRYLIPIHELLRSIMYGDNIYYSPTNTEIINFFECRHYNENEYFLLMLFIALLDDYSKNSRNNGFVELKEIFQYFQGIGYLPKQIDSLLNSAYSKKLFETSEKGNSLELKNTEISIRATNLSIYHLRYLLKTFTYIDAMIIDTPIFSDSIMEEIKNEEHIRLRLDRALIFLNYLDEVWIRLSIQSKYLDWKTTSIEIRNDIQNISKRIKS